MDSIEEEYGAKGDSDDDGFKSPRSSGSKSPHSVRNKSPAAATNGKKTPENIRKVSPTAIGSKFKDENDGLFPSDKKRNADSKSSFADSAKLTNDSRGSYYTDRKSPEGQKKKTLPWETDDSRKSPGFVTL